VIVLESIADEFEGRKKCAIRERANALQGLTVMLTKLTHDNSHQRWRHKGPL
jgi:hypothetical protein